MQERGPIHKLVVLVITIAVLIGYGAFLKWGVDTGNWWWTFPLGAIATVILYFAVTNTKERSQGNEEMRENFRRWKRALNPWRAR